MTCRQWLMAAALLGATGLALFGDRSPASGGSGDALLADPAPRRASVPDRLPPNRAQVPSAIAPEGNPTDILRLQPRAPHVARPPRPDDAEPDVQARLFASHNWTPPPPKVDPGPPPAPVAPPLPYTYLGKKLQGGEWEVYLSVGDDIRVVRAHSVLDERYRVDAIVPPQLTLTYLPLRQVQTLPIGALD